MTLWSKSWVLLKQRSITWCGEKLGFSDSMVPVLIRCLILSFATHWWPFEGYTLSLDTPKYHVFGCVSHYIPSFPHCWNMYIYIYIHTVHNTHCLCCTSTFSLWTDSHNSGIPCLIADRQVLRIQELGSLVQFRHLARFHKTMLRAEVLRDAVSSVFFYVYFIYYIYIHTLFQPWEWEIPSK
jgi:hypothetical protein